MTNIEQIMADAMAGTSQLTRADVEHMSAADIVKARNAGRLNNMFGLPEPTDATGTLTRAELQKLSAEHRHADILKARDEGRIDYTDLIARSNRTD